MHKTIWVLGSTIVCAAMVLVACGGGKGSSRYGAPTQTSAVVQTSTTHANEDVVVTAASFRNIHSLTRVGNHFVGNLAGHAQEALAIAHAGKGQYPVGTIVELVPQEAMVKRRAGFSPATGDWEFFSLDVSAKGTKILSRGGAKVVNRFGGSCASCHGAAKAEFDFVCGTSHGCAPLPIGDDVFAALQQADPRPLR
jgi:hypothetical protein